MKDQKNILDAIAMVNYGFFALYYPDYPLKTDYFEICIIYLNPVSPLYLHSIEYVKQEDEEKKKLEKLRKIELDLMSIKRASFVSLCSPKINDNDVKIITIVTNDHKWTSFGFLNEKNYKNFRIFLETFVNIKETESTRL